MVGRFGPGRRARRRAVVGAAVSAAALLAVSGSAAAEWLPPHDLSPLGNTYGARLVPVADGSIHAFWSRGGVGAETVEHVPGGGWTEPVTLAAPGSEVGAVMPGLTASGDLSALWIQSNGSLMTIQSVTKPLGGGWTTPNPLYTAAAIGGGRFSDAQLAVAPDGTTQAFWTEPDAGTSLSTVRSAERPPGGAWSEPTTISTTANHSFAPKVVVDRQGTATVLWYQAPANDIYASTRPAGGAWSEPERLSHNDWTGGPFVTIADDGTVLAAWRARLPSLRYTMEVAVRPPGGAWTLRHDVDGGTALGNNVDVPAVAIAPDGEMTVAWSRQMGDWYRIQAITRPAGGDTWSEPETISADGRNAFEAQVAYAPDGTLHAAWRRRNDVNYIVQAAERRPDGTWSEPADLSAASTSNLELAFVTLVFDRDGDPVVSWYRSDGVVGRRAQTTVNDTSGPRLADVEVPATATRGDRLSFSVAEPVDTWSEVDGETTWSFGDGTTATGNAAEHAFAAAGTYEVTVSATDALGNRSEQTRTVTVSPLPGEEPPRREEPPVGEPPVREPPRQDPPVTDPPRVQPRPRARARAPVVCRVPKLTGTTLPTAKRRLRAANCRLGKVRYVTTRARRNTGRVVRVSRRAGARLKRGAKVDVTVARRAASRRAARR